MLWMNTIISLIGNSHSKMSIYGDKSSEIVEESREIIAKYIGAEYNEIIFTKSATESLNTCIFGIEHKLKENDEILLSILEHHANIVPYQIIAKDSHSKIKYVYLKEDYGFNYEEFEEKITKKTKIVGITMQSNVTGEEIDIEKICDILKNKSEKLGIDIPYLIIDGSQAITHKKINLKKLKEIFAFVFSGHKLYGPQGIGVLYLKREKIVDKYAAKRAELKIRAKKGDREAIAELAALPRNASPTRLRNRCQINGRPRGYMNSVFQE